MKFTGESKFLISILGGTLILVAVAAFFLSRPVEAIPRSDMLPRGTATFGNEKANVYLVEFSDFQCPACLAFKPAVDRIIHKYKDKLLFGYRHYPLPQHAFGQKAAAAAQAAAQQGKFWQMYEFLFANQTVLSERTVKEGVKQLGLDEKKFSQAVRSKVLQEKIQKDIADGTAFGVRGTPSFFLNGKKLEVRTPLELEETVASEINGGVR